MKSHRKVNLRTPTRKKFSCYALRQVVAHSSRIRDRRQMSQPRLQKTAQFDASARFQASAGIQVPKMAPPPELPSTSRSESDGSQSPPIKKSGWQPAHHQEFHKAHLACRCRYHFPTTRPAQRPTRARRQEAYRVTFAKWTPVRPRWLPEGKRREEGGGGHPLADRPALPLR